MDLNSFSKRRRHRGAAFGALAATGAGSSALLGVVVRVAGSSAVGGGMPMLG